MKKIVLFISVVAVALFAGTKVSAQGKYGPDSTECIKYLSYYTEYFKQKNYDAALPHWRNAYKYCPPTARYGMLTDGTTLMRRLIQKNQNNPVYKQQLVDSLMKLYDQRIEFWPKHRINSLNYKATDMYNYMKDDSQALLAGLTDIISKTGASTKPNIFLFQMTTAVELYKSGMLDPETVINIYETGVKYLAEVTPKNDVEARSIEKTITDFESLFITSQVASCDNLIALFTPRYEANPTDLDLSKNIVRMMGLTEGCMDNDLFLSAIKTVYSIEPSYNSAYYLYKLYSNKGEVETAIQYLEEAIAYEESDLLTDAGYYYELAAFSLKNGKSGKACEAAKKSLELDPSLAGKAYMLIGTVWGSTKCHGNEIDTRAPYWVAVDYMLKAKNADPSLEETANNYIKQYSVYFPETADAFMYNITDGESYTVSCAGMREVTTVRTQKQ